MKLKRLMAALLCGAIVASGLTGCKEGKVINVYAFTDEVPNMLKRYKELHPDFEYEIKETIIATTNGEYQPALDTALKGNNAPDIYCAEAAFVMKYTQGEASEYAATYKELGITDVDSLISSAQIAPYTVEIGTRGSDVVGLAFQATGGAFIYRRSIAKDVWGSDDPATVKGKIGGDWDSFFAAAEELKAKGYKIVSGDGDIWHAIENSSDTPWVVDGKLNIDPKREAFLDHSMKLKENEYHNDTQDWTDAWYADMKADSKVLGFYGPAWLINYVMAGNSGGEKPGEGSYGDWAVCVPKFGFFWGGTWLIGNKTLAEEKNADKRAAVAELIKWITLDSSDDGLQAKFASGTLFELEEDKSPVKDAVASSVVMSKTDGSLEFLGGQNMLDAFIPAGTYASGKNLTQYDEKINGFWRDQVRAYTSGEKDRATAIADFKQKVKDELNIPSE